MDRRAVIILALTVGASGVMASAACTIPFTLGTGGAGGAGTGGGASTGGSVASSSSSGAPLPCGGSCAAGQYCAVSSCATGAGVCIGVTHGASDYAPQCGCDDVTYWNEGLAADAKVGVRAAHACGTVAKPCVPGVTECKTGSCNLKEIAGATGCLPATAGTCWVLPSSCNGTIGTGYQCPGKNCKSACDLIKDEQPWYEAMCP